MSKRDYLAEITSRRSRLFKRAPRWKQVGKRLDYLIEMGWAIEKMRAKDAPYRLELAKYMPIGFVACIEGYFRLVYRDLVDHGDPFRQNVPKLSDIRVALDHIISIQSGKFSLGEFTSHLISIKDLDDINASMSTLLGVDFLYELKNVKTNLFEQDEKKSLQDFGLADELIKDVTTLFELRHIFAHEIANNLKVNPKNIVMLSRGALVYSDSIHLTPAPGGCFV